MAQGHAIQKFHGDERLSVLFADIVNGADVGMIQRGCGLRFTFETGEHLRVAGDVRREKLQRDETVQARILRFVDCPYHRHRASR